jgi:DNA-binding transcriptional LysR family regulator
MELNQLHNFLAVAKTQNITAAAKSLYVTQPTLSSSISRLESELGFKLFDRSGNSITLNESGTVFLNYVERSLGLLDEGIRCLKEFNRSQESSVEFSIPHGGLFSVMRCNYIMSRPDITFRQHTYTSAEAKKAITERQLDFAITFGDISDDKIDWQPVTETELEIQVSASNPLSEKGEIVLRELEQLPFITNTSSIDLMQILSDYCIKEGFVPRVLFSGDEPEFQNTLLKEMGAAIIMPKLIWIIRPTDYKSQLRSRPKNVPLRITGCDLRATIGIARLKDAPMQEPAADFYSFLRDNIAAEPVA